MAWDGTYGVTPVTMIEEKPLVWCWEEVLAEPHDIAFDARLRRQIVSFLRVARCTDGDN